MQCKGTRHHVEGVAREWQRARIGLLETDTRRTSGLIGGKGENLGRNVGGRDMHIVAAVIAPSFDGDRNIRHASGKIE